MMVQEIPPTGDRKDSQAIRGDQKDQRVERHLVESKHAIREAMGAIGKAMSILDRVASELDQYGDAPLDDLERNP